MKKPLLLTLTIITMTTAMPPFDETRTLCPYFTALDSSVDQRSRCTEMFKHQPNLKKTRTSNRFTHVVDSLVTTYNLDKSFSRYNDNGLCQTRTEYAWDSSAGILKKHRMEVFAYNSQGRRVCDTIYDWIDPLNSWRKYYKTETPYDSLGNLVSLTNYRFDTTAESWGPTTKTEVIYNVQANCDDYIQHQWDTTSGTWTPTSKFRNTFDETGVRLSQTDYTWDNASGSWIPHSKYEYINDDYGNIIYETTYRWDTSSESWEGGENPRRKHGLTYDENGTLIKQIDYYWNSPFDTYIESFMFEMTYDDISGSCTSESGYSWDGNDWSLGYKNVFSFINVPLTAILMDDELRSAHEDIDAKNGIVTYKHWEFNSENDTITLVSTWTAYYSPLPGEPVIPQVNNPVQRTFAITRTPTAITVTSSRADSKTQATVYDLQGRTLWKSSIGTFHRIQTVRFPAGVYLLAISDASGKRMKTGNFTKQ